ncbi:MAG: outer membrane protein assembly factor BamA [Bacteroidetes bacterium]|nr:outer membrane protein assembly factor BamA [Bacteroidota bacterium]
MRRIILLVVLLFSIIAPVYSQIITGESDVNIDYTAPREYEIGGIRVEGTKYLDKNVLISISGLIRGDKITIPGEEITNAIKKLWKQKLFADVKIKLERTQDRFAFLIIELEERPRMSRYTFLGVKKKELKDLRENVRLVKGKIVTENLVISTKNTVRNYFINNGFLNVEVDVTAKKDTSSVNDVVVTIAVNKNEKVKVADIIFHGNKEFKTKKLYRTMKETKRKRIWILKSAKYINHKFEDDKIAIEDRYHAEGLRDAFIVSDTVYKNDEKTVTIELTIDEGSKYYFRNITWLGNSKYTTKQLSEILNIKKGDVYSQVAIDEGLHMSANGTDVSSLYMDNGYLFFQVNPIEVLVENDSIDIEVRIFEGQQARINKVTIVGNTKTNDHVILREIRTKPGQLFKRSDIIRSQRELAQLRYFDPEKLAVNPKPNPTDGTVDIEYVVEEKPSDQFTLSGGFGAGRIVGSAGLSFSNFSINNFFKRSAWRPLPSGDGQTLSLRAQSNGKFFRSLNASFVEPWLGGKKPNGLSLSVYNTVQSFSGTLAITGISVGLSRRKKIPDDYFSAYYELGYKRYKLDSSRSFIFSNGKSRTISVKYVLSRNSLDQPLFTRRGSALKFSAEATPPYSVFKDDGFYDGLADEEKYKFAEFYKIKATSSWYTNFTKNLVLYTNVGFGFLGAYSKNLEVPFERFFLGGSGLSGFNLLGQEIISLRGYPDRTLSGVGNISDGNMIISKYTMELRYLLSPNPNATIYALTFAEGGNTWSKFKDFSPFDVKRSVGFGLRIFLPAFGLLGFDFGYGFDSVHGAVEGSGAHGWEPAFIIGMNLGDL